MKQLWNAITCNDVKKLVKPVLWNVLANFANLLPFVCLAVIVGKIYLYFETGEMNRNFFWSAWGVMLVFFVIAYICENIACKVTYHDGFFASAEGRIKLAEHIRRLPLGFLMSRAPGEIGDTMMNDFSKTESAMTHIMPQMVSGVMVGVFASVLMFAKDWRMGIAMFAGFPIAFGIMLGMRGLERKLDARLLGTRVEQADRLQEYLYGMRIIKAYNMLQPQEAADRRQQACSEGYYNRLKNACTDYRDACIRVEGGIGPLNLVAAAFLRSGLSLMTITGVFLMTGGTLAVQDFALFLLVGTRVFDPLSAAIMNYSELMLCGMAGGRIMKLLEEPEMHGKEGAPAEHGLALKNVAFGYGSGTVLKNVSADFAPGTLTAIVGPSGSGKSTMLRLLARFYDPSEGAVFFGGVNEAEIEPEKLMQKISFVFQDVYLFGDTIANNIRYGKENAAQEEIEAAAKLANCYDFIMRQPQGFETIIGESGSTLSGGERQRISIARAILKDAPVVLLDEATASLDPENEAEIQQAVSRLIKDRTVIVIAHRLKTVVSADNILVLDKGTIVESGTHDELLNQNGLYARLWNLQTAAEGWKINETKKGGN